MSGNPQSGWGHYRIPHHQVEAAVLAKLSTRHVSYRMIQATSLYSTEATRAALLSLVQRGLVVRNEACDTKEECYRCATPLELLAAQAPVDEPRKDQSG